MKVNWQLPKAVLRRELTSYFSNPTGYVFISLFVFLGAVAAFWQESFFANNLANLDELNRFFPYLLVFFIPAITMSIWAEERRNGTDELLMTLPATDLEIVLGKYAAALSIYSVALLFSLSHVVVLFFLGSPDLGLMFSTYLGYWLMGAALLGLGMVASLLTTNLTVAFILGALLCAIPVFIDHAGVLVTGWLERLLRGLSFIEQFRDLSRGVIPISSILYFLGFAGAMVFLNVVLLGKRHWPTGKDAPPLGRHYLARAVALIIMVASATILAGRLGGRVDVTAEQIHSLSENTRELLRGLDSKRPVFIQAYLSRNVPRAYLQTRNNIISMLREFDAIGGDAVYARIIETEKYTDQAREAQDRYNIRPRPIPIFEQAPGAPDEIYLGIAFLCGAEEFVIPFFDPGLPVEYELMRSIRVVSRAERKKAGVLQTGAKLFGGFDFENRRQTADWSIVSELRKQYEVVQTPANSEYPAGLDALLVTLPNTLQPEEVERLVEYVKSGKPALILVDPLPAFNIELSPQQQPPNPFQRNAPQRTPADLTPLMDALGVEWRTDQIVWDKYNPHPQFRTLPPEVMFISANQEGEPAFHPEEAVSAGLQELVFLYGGHFQPKEGAATEFVPLLRTGADSGVTSWFRLVQNTIFGVQLNANLPHEPDEKTYAVAARIRGEGEGGPNAILIGDVDMMGEQFFELRRRGVETLHFDNVTFLLNAVDQLAGDESFIALRKRRRKHRTLETVEARTRVYEERRLAEAREAEAEAEQRLKEAQERLDQAVAALQARTDLDPQTKRIMINNQQQIENRRLAVARKNIEDEKERRIERSRAEMEASIRTIQNTIKIAAVALSPVPAFAMFIFVSLRRLKREQLGVSQDRLVEETA